MLRVEPKDVVELLEGTLVGGKYRVERKLGEGGMGVVYGAHHEALGIRVALKLLPASLAQDAEVATRFSNEARAAARLQSEHVARVFDVGATSNGIPYMVMELLEGADLAAIVARSGPLAPDVAVGYVLEALAGI